MTPKQKQKSKLLTKPKAGIRSIEKWRQVLRDAKTYGRHRHIVRHHGQRLLKTAGLGLGYGLFIEPNWIEITHLEIEIAGLDPVFDGYRIIHLTDIHHNIASSRKYLQRVVRNAMQLDPDLIVMTGDYITHNPSRLSMCFEILQELDAPDGVLVVRGNHDDCVSDEEFSAQCEECGFEFLENRHVALNGSRHHFEANLGNSAAQQSLVIAGVEDLWKGRIHLRKALEGAPENATRLLLAHNPMTAELVTKEMNISLVLSGHTHGGQVRPFKKSMPQLTDAHAKYTEGWSDAPHTRVYVSRGIGTSALRFRWNCRPEMSLLTLHPKRNAA